MKYSSAYYYPRKLREEIVSNYLNGEKSYEELSDYYKVKASTIRTWVSRFRESGKVISLHSQLHSVEDMPRKKKEPEKSKEVLSLEARIRELELQNLALNTLIDVAERNGIDIRKKSGAKQ